MKRALKNLMVRQLDNVLENFRPLRNSPSPSKGWLKTIRTALGMPMYQMGLRTGLSQPRVHQIECSEVDGTITLNTLRKFANAMDCELVYAIVPKSSLAQTLERQAYRQAASMMGRVSHTMLLEQQEVSEDENARQIEEMARELLEGPSSALWK